MKTIRFKAIKPVEELYVAVWKDGTSSWVEATSLRQARLLHTLRQKETPVSVMKETRNKYW